MSDAVLHRLREVIAALDRRLRQPDRPGEDAITRASATLRSAAVARIAEIELSAAPPGGSEAPLEGPRVSPGTSSASPSRGNCPGLE